MARTPAGQASQRTDAAPGPQKEDSRRNRRAKYILRACHDCQRRKVRCSGDDPCVNCRARDIDCYYPPKRDAPVKRTRNGRPRDTRETPVNSSQGADQEARTSFQANGDSDLLSWRQRLSRLAVDIQQVPDRNHPPSWSNNLTEAPPSDRGTRPTIHPGFVISSAGSPHSLWDETDLFEWDVTCPRNLSLASQLASLREIVRVRPSSPQPPLAGVPPLDGFFPLELPRPQRLRHLLYVYFRDLHSFFPFLNQDEVGGRIFRALHQLGYSEHVHIIDVDVEHHTVLALLCSMLGMGECLDSEETSEETRPGWTIFMRGRKLLQHCSSVRWRNLDLISYHTLSAAYLLHSELIRPAAQAIMTAVQMAMFAHLNDQSAWAHCSPEEVSARKRLWWTIYFLDRRISQRSGTAYLIRDHDVAVDEFQSRRQLVANDHQASGKTSSGPDSSSDGDYVQVLINLGRVWGHIWDSFFAARAASRGDWEEIELADARILLIRRQLPPELRWNTDELVTSYLVHGETEPQIRRRLAIFIRINLLRTIIRQNPLIPCNDSEDMKRFCAFVARDTIQAIAVFIRTCGRVRPSGFFFTTAVVECMYHLIYVIQEPALTSEHETAIDAFRMANGVLEDLSKTLNSAKRALLAVRSIICILNEDATSPNEPSRQAESIEGPPDDGDTGSTIGSSPDEVVIIEDQMQDAPSYPVTTMAASNTQNLSTAGGLRDLAVETINGPLPNPQKDMDFLQDLSKYYRNLDFASIA